MNKHKWSYLGAALLLAGMLTMGVMYGRPTQAATDPGPGDPTLGPAGNDRPLPPPDRGVCDGTRKGRPGPPSAEYDEAGGDRPGPPDPEQMFTLMDQNQDNTISKDEFMAFHAQRQGPRGMRGQGRPEGPPPPDGVNGQPGGRRGRGWDDAEGTQGPARPGRGRGFQGQDGPPPPGAGPDGRGPGRMDPAKLYATMDANGDGAVSQDEFVAFHARRRGPEGRPGQGPPEGAGPESDPGDLSPRP